jgi:cobalt-zinc-cadmium resistance protein CzcA
MINRWVESALRNRLWVFCGFVGISALGAAALSSLPIDAVPDITHVQVVVNTKTGAIDPGKIEKLVTYRIESEMAGIPGVEEVRSISKYGLSQVTLVFEDSTQIDLARQRVAERLQNIRGELPPGLTPELAPVTTGLGEVLMYTVSAKAGSALAARPEKERLLELREVQEFILTPALKKVRGVAEIDSNGGYLKEIHVNFLPENLKANGLSVEKLIARVETLGESFGGGYIQKDGKQIIVRASSGLNDLETIRRIPLGIAVSGRPIQLRAVADVRADAALRVGAATAGGEETVLGTVLMRTGANSREVSLAAAAALRELRLPEGVEVRVTYSRSSLVEATIGTVARNLAEGAALVIVILFLLLGNARAALVVALAIPISMLFALKGMAVFGISANLMSLGAIDFGLLVDGSVVLIENVVRRFERRAQAQPGVAVSPADKLRLVLDASAEVVQPLVFGLFIIMLVYVPILYLEGIEGKMFRPMAEAVLLALGASLLVALFLMPALAYLLLSARADHVPEPRLARLIQRVYEPALKATLRRKWIAAAVTVAPAAVALVLFFRLGSDFVPQLDEGDLVLCLARDTQMDIDTSVRVQKQAEKVIAGFGEVQTVFSRLGTPESALDPMGAYLADTFIVLKRDLTRWPLIEGRRRTKAELAEAIKRQLDAAIPAQEVSATQPIEMRFNEILEGSRADVSLRIFGPDLEKLLEFTTRAKEILAGMKGVDSMESDPLTSLTKSPILDVQPNYERIARYGVSLKEVNSILESSMSGKEVGSFYQADRRFPVVVHLDESLRNDVAQVSGLPVGLPEGGTVPLSSVADIRQSDQVTTIARSGAKRYSAVSIFLKDRDVAGFVAEAQARIHDQLKIPEDYEAVWGGQFKNLERAQGRLFLIVPGTLVVIFLLLLRSFGTFRHALLVFSAIPFAMAGGVFSLYLRGINFSVSAAIGFIALTGIATLNSMVLVTYFNQLRSQGVSLDQTVLQGALARLRPVMMTALVASLGFIPMAFNTGMGAEVQRPLATVVIGGLVTSTLLTLIAVPALYHWIETRWARRTRADGERTAGSPSRAASSATPD